MKKHSKMYVEALGNVEKNKISRFSIKTKY